MIGSPKTLCISLATNIGEVGRIINNIIGPNAFVVAINKEVAHHGKYPPFEVGIGSILVSIIQYPERGLLHQVFGVGGIGGQRESKAVHIWL